MVHMYTYVPLPPTHVHKHTIENLWRVAILSHTYEQTSLSYAGHSASRANRTSKLLVCLLATLHRPSKDHYEELKIKGKSAKVTRRAIFQGKRYKFNSAVCAYFPTLNVISSVLNPEVVTAFWPQSPSANLIASSSQFPAVF